MKLQNKFLIAFVPVLLVSGGGLTVLAKHSVHKIVVEEAAHRGWAFLQNLEERSVLGFETEKERILLPVLESAMQESGALYAAAIDAQGRVIAHTDVVEKGKVYHDALAIQMQRFGRPAFVVETAAHRPVLEVAWPVHIHRAELEGMSEDFVISAGKSPGRKRLGALRLGLPLDEALATETRITRQLILLLFLTGSVVLGLALLLMQGVLQPVHDLADATEAIGQGRYGSKVPVLSADELGDLAKSFNRMSQALTETTVSKDFLDSILENMLDPLIVLGQDGRIRMVNRATLELLGYGVGELIGKPAYIIFARTNTVLDRVAKEGFVNNIELNFRSKTDRIIPVFFSGSMIKDKAGTPIGVIVVAKDIMERKKMESEILQAEKLSAVGRLASGVAHEINNPLGVILGFAQGALWDIKPGDPLEFPLRSIERESNRCKNLVQDLLTFSRITKKGYEPMDLNEAVESAFSLVSAQAKLKHVQIVKDLAREMPRMVGNQNQIQQIVINLANNALDAMEAGGTLTVRTCAMRQSSEAWICLYISDTGSGIPADILPRIFEPFFTTKPVGQGTGLGLGLVHEIVKRHSGQIDVQSRTGFTEFCVKFPAAADQTSKEAAA